MPKGPKGQKRPTDVISNAITVMKIATGEIEVTLTKDGKSIRSQSRTGSLKKDARPDRTGAAAVVSDSPLSAHAEATRIRFWLAEPN